MVDVDREVEAMRRRAIEWATEHPSDSPVAPIERGLAPNGLVFRTLVDGKVVHEAKVSDPNASPDAALRGGEQVIRALGENRQVELRIYDGDTGGWILTRQVVVVESAPYCVCGHAYEQHTHGQAVHLSDGRPNTDGVYYDHRCMAWCPCPEYVPDQKGK